MTPVRLFLRVNICKKFCWRFRWRMENGPGATRKQVRELLGRDTGNRGRTGVLRRRFGIVRGRGSRDRPSSLAFQYRPSDTCFADDFCGGGSSIRCHRRGQRHFYFFTVPIGQFAYEPRDIPRRLGWFGEFPNALSSSSSDQTELLCLGEWQSLHHCSHRTADLRSSVGADTCETASPQISPPCEAGVNLCFHFL